MQAEKKLKKFFFENWPIIAIILLAAFLRLYRLEELTGFTGDQGIDLLAVKKIIVEKKFTLLGPKTSVLPIYNGPFYYYLILPILYLSKLNPLSVSYLMVFLWLGAVFFIYLTAKTVFGKNAGLFAAFLFSIWPLSVQYSRISFNSYPTPFFASIYIYAIFLFFKKQRLFYMAIAGLCFGIMMQLHYFNFFLISISIFYLFFRKKLNFKSVLVFLTSFLVAFSPMIMFEVRHDFFNLRTLIFSMSHQGMSNFAFRPHYFISFFPLIFVFVGQAYNIFFTKYRLIAFFLILIIYLASFYKMDLGKNHGDSMPEGWNMKTVRQASRIIAENSVGNFNVAAILDGDTRAHPYRYFIEVFGKKPLPVENYPEAEVLYVIGKGDNNYIINYPVWEIYSFLPAKITKVWPVSNGIGVYKLEKLLK